MPESAIFAKLGISVLLGLLVGIQREHAEAGIGVRTFAMIPVLGTICGLLAEPYGGWVVAAGFLGMIGILFGIRATWLRAEDFTHGTTTELAALVMYAVGALLVAFPMVFAIAIGGGVAILLQAKPQLHGIVQKLGKSDLKAIMQFVLITCIILPVLPNETYGPFRVFNPFETWLLVALIVGMNLIGYISCKFVGQNAGIALGGLLGGAVSSTATTVSYSRQAKGGQIGNAAASVAILIASTVVYGRVIAEIAVVAPEFLRSLAVPLGVLIVLTAIPTVVVWLGVRKEEVTIPEQENPTQLKSAVLFGAMYAAVLNRPGRRPALLRRRRALRRLRPLRPDRHGRHYALHRPARQGKRPDDPPRRLADDRHRNSLEPGLQGGNRGNDLQREAVLEDGGVVCGAVCGGSGDVGVWRSVVLRGLLSWDARVDGMPAILAGLSIPSIVHLVHPVHNVHLPIRSPLATLEASLLHQPAQGKPDEQQSG